MDDGRGRLRFRLLALLQVLGGLFILAFAVFPTPTTRPGVDVVLGLASIVLAAVTWFVLPGRPAWAVHASVAASTLLTGVLVYLMAADQGQVFSSYGFVMTGAFAASFFAWRGLAGHLVLIAAAWLGACLLNRQIVSPVILIVILAIVVLISVAFHVVTVRARSTGERLRAVWESQIDPSVLLDPVLDPRGTVVDLVCVEANDEAARLLRMPRAQLVGQTLLSLRPDPVGTGLVQVLATTLETGDPLVAHHVAFDDARLGAGRYYDVRAFRADRSLVLTWSDVTDRAAAEREVARLARSDDLTGFLNRRAGLERLASLLADRRTASRLAVLFCDLDRFKDVNDAHGHEVGDHVIQAVAHRVRSALRHDDVVVRTGGDEFLVVLVDVVRVEDAQVLAEKIRAAVEQSILGDQGDLCVGISIGLVRPQEGETVDEVVARADAVMYEAKRQGRGRVVRG